MEYVTRTTRTRTTTRTTTTFKLIERDARVEKSGYEAELESERD